MRPSQDNWVRMRNLNPVIATMEGQWIPPGTIGWFTGWRSNDGKWIEVDWHTSPITEEFSTARTMVTWVETLDGRPVA